jgi:hypothetical protein
MVMVTMVPMVTIYNGYNGYNGYIGYNLQWLQRLQWLQLGGDLQPGCLADRLRTGLGQLLDVFISSERKRISLVFC